MLQKSYSFKNITIENDDTTKEGLLLCNDSGIIVDKDTALSLINMLVDFYEIDDVGEWIDQENIKINKLIEKNNEKRRKIMELKSLYEVFLHYGFSYDKTNDKHIYDKPIYRKKHPNLKSIDEWTFACKWCNEKTTIGMDEYFYWANYSEHYSHGGLACSEDCAKDLSLEIQKEWIHEQEYDLFFKDGVSKLFK